MSSYAQEAYEKKNPNYSDFDRSLYSLLEIEYQIYIDKEDELIQNFIELADQIATKDRFRTIRSIIDGFKSHPKENSLNSLKEISKIFIALADSNRQSRSSRSGNSFMHHISYLLEKNGFKRGESFKREVNVTEECKLDFFFPDSDVYISEPMNCCAIACQTTSNDRYRLIFAQLPKNTRNRACTAIGHPNFGKKLGLNSLSETKLKNAKSKGFKFVLMDQVLNEGLRNNHSIMTYNELLDKLRHLRNFW